MNPNLYFIPVLLRAYDEPDRQTALGHAFDEIHSLGKRPEFRRGYAQFLDFMGIVRDAYLRHDSEPEFSEQRDEENPVGEANLNPKGEIPAREDLLAWADDPDFQTLVKEAIEAHVPSAHRIRVCLRRNEEQVQEIPITGDSPRAVFSGLMPGKYVISLSTGQVLWDVELSQNELLLAYAFPGTPLKFAADTGGEKEQPSVERMILDGGLTICIFPGREAGRMELVLCSIQA